jgi:hypothetical protein
MQAPQEFLDMYDDIQDVDRKTYSGEYILKRSRKPINIVKIISSYGNCSGQGRREDCGGAQRKWGL